VPAALQRERSRLAIGRATQHPSTRPPTDQELLDYVARWLDILAAGRGDEACSLLDEPNVYDQRWSPTAIQEVLQGEVGPSSVYADAYPEGPRFSPVDQAEGDPRRSVIALADGSGFSVHHAVPLNGEFSDLTAECEFIWRGSDLAFRLHDLHVQ
jgi:hypothetical protein